MMTAEWWNVTVCERKFHWRKHRISPFMPSAQWASISNIQLKMNSIVILYFALFCLFFWSITNWFMFTGEHISVWNRPTNKMGHFFCSAVSQNKLLYGQLNTCSELFFLEILFKIHGNLSFVKKQRQNRMKKRYLSSRNIVSTEQHVCDDNNPQLHT